MAAHDSSSFEFCLQNVSSSYGKGEICVEMVVLLDGLHSLYFMGQGCPCRGLHYIVMRRVVNPTHGSLCEMSSNWKTNPSKIRPLRKHYFQNTQGLIFVVDSNDQDLAVEARDELRRVLNEGCRAGQGVGAVLLVFAKKQDLPNAMNAAEITDKLGFHSLRQRPWYLQITCATSGEGLYEGLDWLSNIIAKKANCMCS